MIYRILIIVIFSLSNLFSNPLNDFNCFTIIVGKKVSECGSVIIAHNEDDNGKQLVNLFRTASKLHSVEEKVKFNNGGEIDQIKQTNGYIWVELPGMKVADTYLNDNGVIVTSNGCPSREDQPDSTDGGILYWIRRIVAERSSSAKQGVKLAGSLIEKYGYVSEGRTYTIADNKEAWVLSAVYGKHWIAQRVPDDQVAVIPNYYTIGNIDLDDTLNFLGSADIVKYAIQRGWYDPSQNEKFHFAKAYTAETSINHPGNINRIWRGINLLSEKEYSIDEDLPFSFSPYKKISVNEIMNILRDHYEYSELDKSELYSEGNPHFKNYATICSESTQYSFVAVLRDNLPKELNTLMWFTYFRPCVNFYVPIYLSIRSFEDYYAHTDPENAIHQHFNPDDEIFEPNQNHIYWDYVRKVEMIDSNFVDLFPPERNKNYFFQKELLRETSRFEKALIDDYDENKENIEKMLNDYSNQKLRLLKASAENSE
jgi:dipeptidase